MAALCGPGNAHLRLIQDRTGVRIRQRNGHFHLQGGGGAVKQTQRTLYRLYCDAESQPLTPNQVHLRLTEAENEPAEAALESDLDRGPKIRTPQRVVVPQSEDQRRLMQALAENELCFAVGPAGTGKTWLCAAQAVACLRAGEVDRIVLVRPVLEAGEKLGFLPGDANEKISPHQRPLYDAIGAFVGRERLRQLFDQDQLELAPIAYMRGRTLHRSFIILDEAQNATGAQMQLVLTRIGFGSRCAVTGDPSQSDLAPDETSGLNQALDLLDGLPSTAIVRLGAKSIVRHPLVRHIVRRYWDDGAQKKGGDAPGGQGK